MKQGLPQWPCGEVSTYNAGDAEDVGLILVSVRSPLGGHGNPLQHACLKYAMDRYSPQGHKESDMNTMKQTLR